jgi:hypothetical protein
VTLESGERFCEENDVVLLYRVVHGRVPESTAVIEEAKSQPLTGFVRSALSCREFEESVVSGLANRRGIPHLRLSARPTRDEVSWLLPHIELGPDTLAKLGSAQSWEDFFRLLFADATFRRWVPALRDTALLQELPRRFQGPRIATTEEPVGLESGLPRRRRRDRERSDDLVIVTGMHRSGTSLCANVIGLLGVDMSDEIEPTADNPAGHWERPELIQFHDRVLRTFGRGWYDLNHGLHLPPDWLSEPAVQEQKEEIEDWVDARLLGSGRLHGFKDPRAARLLALWDQICADLRLSPRYVFCVRHPALVARSLARRDGIGAPDAAYRWMVYNSDAVRSLGDRRVCIVPFDEWFVDSGRLLDRLASFLGVSVALDSPILRDLIMRAIDPGLRHDEAPPKSDTLATELYRHLVESAPFNGFSVAAREASKAFLAVDDFMQPVLEAALFERSPVGKKPASPASGESYDADLVRLAARLAANLKLHSEALGSVLEKLELQSKRSTSVEATQQQPNGGAVASHNGG